jgi:hypothetical protein
MIIYRNLVSKLNKGPASIVCMRRQQALGSHANVVRVRLQWLRPIKDVRHTTFAYMHSGLIRYQFFFLFEGGLSRVNNTYVLVTVSANSNIMLLGF